MKNQHSSLRKFRVRISYAAIALLRFCLLVGIAVQFVAGVASAGVVTISEDTTIDDDRYIDDLIQVVSGTGGPTTVRILEGATVQGFRAADDSHVILDGGNVSFLSSLLDTAKFTMLSGDLGCIQECLGIDAFEGHLVSRDGSEVHYYDGLIYSIYSTNMSGLHVFGTDLQKMLRSASGNTRTYLITGTTVNGNPINEFLNSGFGGLDVGVTSNAEVILHEVPEPTTAVTAIYFVVFLLGTKQEGVQ